MPTHGEDSNDIISMARTRTKMHGDKAGVTDTAPKRVNKKLLVGTGLTLYWKTG